MLKNLLTFVALAVMMTVAATTFAQTEGSPTLVVASKVMDAGTVSQGTTVDAVFDLVNEGDTKLVIKAVRPTCGCTVADFDKEIAPGATGHIKAKLDTKDFSGPISKSILVMTDDPQSPTVTLVIKANIRPFVEILPRPLIRFNAVLNEPMNQTFIVVGADPEAALTVRSVESSVPFLATSMRQLGGDELIEGKSKSQYEITLSLTDDAPVGPVNAVLSVNTDLKEAPKVPVKVYGVIRALIHVTPSQVQFGSVEAKSRPGRNLIVVNNRSGGVKVSVQAASINDAAFNAEVVTIEQGRRYQITVTVKPDATPGPRDAVLTIKTSDAEFPEVEVPVRANIS